VISCWDDEEWRRFCSAAGREAWIIDLRFATLPKRKENERELNELIAEWTRDQDAVGVMSLLQSSGVHAGVVNTMRDLFSDPQIAFRNIWQEREHSELGRHNYRMVSYQLSETPGGIRQPAPCLGQDNERVFLEWLDLSRTEYQELQEQGVFS